MNKPPEFTDKCCLSFVLCLVFQLCPTLCDSIDCSLPSSSVHRDSPGKILEWVAISSSRGSSQPRGLNPGLPHCRCILYRLSHQGSPPPFFFFWSFKPSKKYLRVYFSQAYFLNNHSETWERRDKGRGRGGRKEKKIGCGCS